MFEHITYIDVLKVTLIAMILWLPFAYVWIKLRKSKKPLDGDDVMYFIHGKRD